ncbi:MAG: FAD-dependent oxidoreductase [Candidatus Omnitrophica bacterium]|nr:FAD-dependent oxidoreductase [Candidatus Omnitrophota bacterium]
MQKVLIIGGGFAGLSAAQKLCRYKKTFNISLIDKQAQFNFLPMLPDVIGRRVNPGRLVYGLEDIGARFGFEFIRGAVTSVDLKMKLVQTSSGPLKYDYLIIASGSETNFYNNRVIEKYACKLDNAEDSRKILQTLNDSDFDEYVVSGGGYTGIEIAISIKEYLSRRAKAKRVIIVERQPNILGMLPEWMKSYALSNLQKLGIEVLCNNTVEKIEGRRVFLSGKETFENALLIWCAGVRTADFVQAQEARKNPQGRLIVDGYLRLDEFCFVAGDAACVASGQGFLRMAVQFAITEGRVAAENIKNLVYKRPLKKYRPLDLGLIIPMANNRSCGKVMGIKMRGFPPTLFHFLMCIYRSYGLKNKFGVIKDLLVNKEV